MNASSAVVITFSDFNDNLFALIDTLFVNISALEIRL